MCVAVVFKREARRREKEGATDKKERPIAPTAVHPGGQK